MPKSWRALVAPAAMQAGLLSALGAGLYTLRYLARPALHPLVAARVVLAERHPALAAALSQLGTLGNDAAFAALLAKVDAILALDAQGGPAAQWQISRLSAEVVRDADALCKTPLAARSDEVFRAVLTCKDEAVPQIRGQLDDLLHNHLLARSPVYA